MAGGRSSINSSGNELESHVSVACQEGLCPGRFDKMPILDKYLLPGKIIKRVCFGCRSGDIGDSRTFFFSGRFWYLGIFLKISMLEDWWVLFVGALSGIGLDVRALMVWRVGMGPGHFPERNMLEKYWGPGQGIKRLCLEFDSIIVMMLVEWKDGKLDWRQLLLKYAVNQ